MHLKAVPGLEIWAAAGIPVPQLLISSKAEYGRFLSHLKIMDSQVNPATLEIAVKHKSAGNALQL